MAPRKTKATGAETQGAGSEGAGSEGAGALLEFLQGPVVRGAVLQILNLHGHHGAGERPRVALHLRLRRQQLGRQRRVQGVREQHKLELNLKPSDTHKPFLTQTMTTPSSAAAVLFKAATFPSGPRIHHGYTVSSEVLMSRLGLGGSNIYTHSHSSGPSSCRPLGAKPPAPLTTLVINYRAKQHGYIKYGECKRLCDRRPVSGIMYRAPGTAPEEQ